MLLSSLVSGYLDPTISHSSISRCYRSCSRLADRQKRQGYTLSSRYAPQPHAATDNVRHERHNGVSDVGASKLVKKRVEKTSEDTDRQPETKLNGTIGEDIKDGEEMIGKKTQEENVVTEVTASSDSKLEKQDDVESELEQNSTKTADNIDHQNTQGEESKEQVKKQDQPSIISSSSETASASPKPARNESSSATILPAIRLS